MFRLGKRSRSNLLGVHPDLVLVVGRAISISPTDFAVIEGRRSITRQRLLMEEGKSKTLKSRHLTGHAVDVVPWLHGRSEWEAWHLFEDIAKAFKQASEELGIPIFWGGDWETFKDGPHFQLDWLAYPVNNQPSNNVERA